MKLSDIKLNPNNPRLIKDDRFKSLVKSIKELPKMMILRPIIIDDDNVIQGGNMRYRALKELGYTEINDTWVKQAKEFTKKELEEFLIKDNISFGQYDYEMLANQYDMESLLDYGMDEQELVGKYELLEPEETEGDDDVPEQAPAITVKGDLYELDDKHRVLCGDSTMIDDVDRLMGGVKADMYLSDPPYNVAYEGKTKEKLTIQNDEMKNDDFRAFLRDAFQNVDTVMKEGGVFYIWHADSEGYNFRGACFDIGWKVRQCLIWNKNSLVMGRQDYHWKHEPCLYGWKDGSGHLWATDRKQTTILEFNRPSRSEMHPTMKPVDLLQYQVTNNTNRQDIIIDNFLGSGSTLIACEKTNRKCYGMELDEKYCDVIVKRYVDFCKKNDKPYSVKRNGEECNDFE